MQSKKKILIYKIKMLKLVIYEDIVIPVLYNYHILFILKSDKNNIVLHIYHTILPHSFREMQCFHI